MSYPPAGNEPPYAPPPAYGGYGPGGYGPPPANNLVLAILVTIFCCLPLGIVGIIYAAQVNSKWAAGDPAGARESARKARLFSIWGAVLGLIAIAIYVIFVVLAGGGADTMQNF